MTNQTQASLSLTIYQEYNKARHWLLNYVAWVLITEINSLHTQGNHHVVVNSVAINFSLKTKHQYCLEQFNSQVEPTILRFQHNYHGNEISFNVRIVLPTEKVNYA